jgi:hypothetical protein
VPAQIGKVVPAVLLFQKNIRTVAGAEVISVLDSSADFRLPGAPTSTLQEAAMS